MSKKPENLPAGSILDHYRIERILGGGGFSIVYLATDLQQHRQVVIKEYFPAKLAQRADNNRVEARSEGNKKLYDQGRKLFFQEAALLASLRHPNIVEIVSFFHANDTVYTVMAYEKGLSLHAYIKKYGGRRSEEFILKVFHPVLECLKVVHEKGLLHLDIKPGNIFLRPSHGPLLLDFGAAHKLMLSADARLFPIVSQGFSPIEQTLKGANLGPWSDIYAIGATIRTCMEGHPPLAAKKRKKDDTLPPAALVFAGEYSDKLLEAIDWAMALMPEDRPQSVDEFIRALPPQT